MPKAKKPPHDDSQIEEIDLSLIDSTSIDFSQVKNELPSFEDKSKIKKSIGVEQNDFDGMKDEPIDDLEFELKGDFEDDFEDDFDESDEEEIDGDGENKNGYKTPKDFFTDKRRKKSLKKFIDVTIPAEFLE